MNEANRAVVAAIVDFFGEEERADAEKYMESEANTSNAFDLIVIGIKYLGITFRQTLAPPVLKTLKQRSQVVIDSYPAATRDAEIAAATAHELRDTVHGGDLDTALSERL